MSGEDAREIERGFLSAALGAMARSIAFEEAVILIDREHVLACLTMLRSEGWDELGTIYSHGADGDAAAVLTYRLRSKQRLHRTIGVQLTAGPANICRSIASAFANARACEEALTRDHGFVFV